VDAYHTCCLSEFSYSKGADSCRQNIRQHFIFIPFLFTAILNFAIVFFYDIKDGLLVVLLFIIGLTHCPFFFLSEFGL
jgi:hypothetical protein